eukprot:2872419-Prymnesium_polylepis.2
MAVNTKLTMEQCCGWLVGCLGQNNLRATDLLATEQMLAAYGISEKDAAIRSWLFESVTADQQAIIDEV